MLPGKPAASVKENPYGKRELKHTELKILSSLRATYKKIIQHTRHYWVLKPHRYS